MYLLEDSEVGGLKMIVASFNHGGSLQVEGGYLKRAGTFLDSSCHSNQQFLENDLHVAALVEANKGQVVVVDEVIKVDFSQLVDKATLICIELSIDLIDGAVAGGEGSHKTRKCRKNHDKFHFSNKELV